MEEKQYCDICGDNFVEKQHIVSIGSLKGVDAKIYNLVKCKVCDTVFVNPLPTEANLAKFYSLFFNGKLRQGIVDWDDFISANKQSIEDGMSKIRYIEKYANYENKKRKLLDVGSGYGFFLYAAMNSGYNSYGVDLNKEAIKFAKEKMNIEIYEESIYDLCKITENNFDVVTAWTVIEHLTSPRKCCSEINKILKMGGIFAGAVPNMDGIGYKLYGKKWHLMIPPEHIFYFNKKAIKQLLMNNGFYPIFVGTIPLYASPYFSFKIRINLMKLSKKLNSRLLKSLLLVLHRALTLTKRHVVYRALNTVIMLFHLGGDNIFFVAKKVSCV